MASQYLGKLSNSQQRTRIGEGNFDFCMPYNLSKKMTQTGNLILPMGPERDLMGGR